MEADLPDMWDDWRISSGEVVTVSMASYYSEQLPFEYNGDDNRDDFEPSAPKHNPGKQIKYNLDRLIKGQVATFEIPVWLKTKKGWNYNRVSGRVITITSRGVEVRIGNKTDWLPLGWVKVINMD